MPPFRIDTTNWAVLPKSAVTAQPVLSPHHAHHALSRRAFIGRTAGAAGAALGATLLQPGSVLAAKPFNATPTPSANTVTLTGPFGPETFHFTFFGPGVDPTSITDFNGFVGVADVQGSGTGSKPDGSTETLLFDSDMRFMSGVYVGADGAVHKGAFGFV